MRSWGFALLLVLLASCRGDSGWERKDAYRRCPAVIAEYPERPAPNCRALHVCANEARLTAAETAKLREIIAATPDCPAP